jgi:hypothetical protein
MPNTEDYAIVVGINQYPGFGDLDGSERDAQSFYDWLTSRTGGDVPTGNVKLILSSQFTHATDPNEAKPIVSDIQAKLDQLEDIANTNDENGRGTRVGRRLYFYFAGHGFAFDPRQTALLMANATISRTGYHIVAQSYANWFQLSGYFDEIILLLDCCQVRRQEGIAPNPPHFQRTFSTSSNKVKCFYGFAAKWGRVALELGGGTMPVHGVFTAALLEGLKGKAADSQGRVTSTSLKNYLYTNMKKFLPPVVLNDPQAPKEPDFDTIPEVGNDIIFAQTGVPRCKLRFKLRDTSVPKERIRIKKNRDVITEIEIHSDDSVDLQPGIYAIEVFRNGIWELLEAFELIEEMEFDV